MCIKNQQKKPAKLVSIICTARNGQFISMLYGIIIFFQPYVHLFKKIADNDFCLFMKKLESIITVSHKVHFLGFFLFFILFEGAALAAPGTFGSQCLSYLSL